MYLGTDVRVGMGFDVHRLSHDPPVIMGGVVVDAARGVIATSDGDVVAHAVADAVLGSCSLGDMGEHFPSSDPRFEGADSMELLARTAMLAHGAGWYVAACDVTVLAEAIPIAPHRPAIRANLADRLGTEVEVVSVKATTTDGLGLIGEAQAVAAWAIVTARSLS